MKNHNIKHELHEGENFEGRIRTKDEFLQGKVEKTSSEKYASLGEDINFNEQTPEKNKDHVLQRLLKAKEKCPTQDELKALGFEPLPLSKFGNFEQFVASNGKLDGGELGHFAIRYLDNFPPKEVEIGEYDDGYAVYRKIT